MYLLSELYYVVIHYILIHTFCSVPVTREKKTRLYFEALYYVSKVTKA
jgi:hypothetical protein